MNLTGSQKQQLHQALLSAFPDRGAVERMVHFRLDMNLETVVGKEGLEQVVFKLLAWAESQGRLDELIKKAYEENPGNPDLRACVQQLHTDAAAEEPASIHFVDFHLRGWQLDDRHAQVLVHSSSAGSFRTPLTVTFDPGQRDSWRQVADDQWQGPAGTRRRVEELGQQLASVLLPAAVTSLLVRSLERLAPWEGLRLRLCLDDALIDLPWEFLYSPEVTGGTGLDGFPVLNPRISLVREAPVTRPTLAPLRQKQRLVFAGALRADGFDLWKVKDEYQELAQSLQPLADFLNVEFCSAAGNQIEQMLNHPAAIFHYSGHTDCQNARGYLVRELRNLAAPDVPGFGDIDPLYSDRLDDLLRKAGTRLAVFSACYSGRWPFVAPLLQAGLSALVGIQGRISIKAAGVFFQKLYAALAVGLSLDEAAIWARQTILDAGVSPGAESCEWGALMIYLPASEAVLLPRSEEQEGVHRSQERIRRGWGSSGGLRH